MLHTSNHRVERLSSPRGIVAANPEFTWELASDHAGDMQTACAVEVALRSASGQRTSCWESGKLVQPIGESVHYAGTPLESRSDYQWRVKVWDASGAEGDWCPWSGFETGIIAPDGWSAQWIAGGGALRGSFEIRQQPIRARAYVSGLGYYEFFCNGKKISAAALAPSYTDFDRRVEYEIVDLLPPCRKAKTAAASCWRMVGGDSVRRPRNAESKPSRRSCSNTPMGGGKSCARTRPGRPMPARSCRKLSPVPTSYSMGSTWIWAGCKTVGMRASGVRG